MRVNSVRYINTSNEIDLDGAIKEGMFPCAVFCNGVEVDGVLVVNLIDGYLKHQIVIGDNLIADESHEVISNYMFGDITYKKLEDDH